MRKMIIGGVAAIALLLGAAAPQAFAQQPPCNDADGDGKPSGREYAAHHIVPLAHAQGLGAHGHIPGSHQGFSVCDPSSL